MIKITHWNSLSTDNQCKILARPTHAKQEQLITKTKEIISQVKSAGDKALKFLTEKYDGTQLTSIQVSPQEITAAKANVSTEAVQAIEFAIRQVSCYHQAQLPNILNVTTIDGVVCRREPRPIQRVGLYIPGGSAPLVSTVIMLAIPAKLSGCPLRVLATPPNQDGLIDPHILVAAQLCNIEIIYKIGGAQAIAALAYGTETVQKVDKIFGPGNAWVTQAKSLVAQDAGGASLDLPAGPSELLIIADEQADPRFIAADLLSQAEHGPDSQVILITTSETLAAEVNQQIDIQCAKLSRKSIMTTSLAHSHILIVKDIKEAITISNTYAPEHLILQIANPEFYTAQIQCAGAVFLGPWTPETLGDYVTGSNHVLPTYGYARNHSGLSVTDFMTFISFQTATLTGLTHLSKAAETLAHIEGLDAHKNAVTLRVAEIEKNNWDITAAKDSSTPRSAVITRNTNETKIVAKVDLDRRDPISIHTGVGFFDHMLEQLAKHGQFSLSLHTQGDLHIDDHHVVEDTALTLGQALRQALGDKRGIARYGFLLPMDESLAQIAIDLSGRPYFVFHGQFPREKVGELSTELVPHFFRSLAESLAANIHITVTGENAHHMVEAIFKGVGRTLAQAFHKQGDELPSTKGVL